MTAMKLDLSGDRRITITRRFAAPPALVYRAHTEAALIRQWMNGIPGWEITECACDARPGGAMRYAWSGPEGAGFHLTGEFLELTPGARILHVERMFVPEQTPDNHIETLFTAEGDGTLLTMTMTLPDEAARRAMLATGMEEGMSVTYDKLDALLAGGL